MYYIGIDLGTSAVKLLMMDENGEVVRIVSRTYPLHLPQPGWSEQDPADWYAQTVSGLAELIRGVGADTLSPKTGAARAQTATLLMRFSALM